MSDLGHESLLFATQNSKALKSNQFRERLIVPLDRQFGYPGGAGVDKGAGVDEGAGIAGIDEGDIFYTGSLFYTGTLFCRDAGIEEGSGRCRK